MIEMIGLIAFLPVTHNNDLTDSLRETTASLSPSPPKQQQPKCESSGGVCAPHDAKKQKAKKPRTLSVPRVSRAERPPPLLARPRTQATFGEPVLSTGTARGARPGRMEGARDALFDRVPLIALPPSLSSPFPPLPPSPQARDCPPPGRPVR